MVRYDYVCVQGHVFEVVAESGNTQERTCLVHGTPAHYKPSFNAQPEFKPFWHPHLDKEPVLIESRQQYARECEARGLNGPYNRTSDIKRRDAKQGVPIGRRKRRRA